jgi:hypothetical protein
VSRIVTLYEDFTLLYTVFIEYLALLLELIREHGKSAAKPVARKAGARTELPGY